MHYKDKVVRNHSIKDIDIIREMTKIYVRNEKSKNYWEQE